MGSPGTVAVVSDDLMFSSRLQTSMRRAGGDAIRVAGNDVPSVDTVFVDLNSGVEDRLELITRLRRERPTLEIVGFCSHGERELRRRALRHGATRVVNNGALQEVALRLSGATTGGGS